MAGNKYLSLALGAFVEIAASQSSAGAADAGKIVALDSNGQIASSMYAYNATNLKITAGQLNTIQDIATASTPQFAKLGIGTTPTNLVDISGAGTPTLKITSTDNTPALISGNSDRTSAGVDIFSFGGQWNGNNVARIAFRTGADTVNKDDGYMRFLTSNDSSTLTEAMRITQDQNILIGTTTDDGTNKLQVAGTAAVVSPSAAAKPLIVKGAASQTANLAEFQDSTGTAFFTIGPSTVANDGSIKPLTFAVTGPSAQNANFDYVTFQVTGAGNAAYQARAFAFSFAEGYTGSNVCRTLTISNANAGTGASIGSGTSTNPVRFGNGNCAGNFVATGGASGTTGWVCGANINATGSSVFNVAAVISASCSKSSPANNLGAFISSGLGTVNTGAWIGIWSAGNKPTLVDTALQLDNGSGTTDIFTAQDNGTTKVRIADGGNIVCAEAARATNATDGFLYLPTCAGTPTGTPTAYTGTVAAVYDTTNNKLYVYNGAWKGTAALT